VEWVVGYENDSQKVVYQFDGSMLVRRATVGGRHSTVSIPCKTTERTFQFLITIEPESVQVKSPICERADTYSSPDNDLTEGKTGIKRDLLFIIR
jgi:hypothetical protein